MITRRSFFGLILAAPAAIKAALTTPTPIPFEDTFEHSSGSLGPNWSEGPYWDDFQYKEYAAEIPIDFEAIDATTLEILRRNVVYDNFFGDDPMLRKLRSSSIETFDGGKV